MLSINLNGTKYTDFTSASVKHNMNSIAGAFTFNASAKRNEFPIKLGDTIEVLADDIKILTGYVEEMIVTYDATMHEINFSGRSKLVDFIDSSVTQGREFTGGATLIGIANALLKDIGLTDIKVINNVSDLTPFKSSEIASATQDQTCADFLLSFARKKQVYINSSADGNLIITRGNTGNAPTRLQNIYNGNANNIKQSFYSINTFERFNKYRCISTINAAGLESLISPQNIASQVAVVYDNDMRTTRQLTIVAEESADTATCQKRATWEANIRRANSLEYSATVAGHTVNGSAWEIGKIVYVKDEMAGIDSELLIKGVEMNYANDKSETILTCTYSDAYTLAAEETEKDKKTNKKNNILQLLVAE